MAEENRKISMQPWTLPNRWQYMEKTEILSIIWGRCWQSHHNGRLGTNRADACHGNMGNVGYVSWLEMHHNPSQSWNCWKEPFNNVFNKLKELNAITTGSMEYGAATPWKIWWQLMLQKH